MIRTYPSGKGMYIWQIKQIEKGDPEQIADRLQELGCSWTAVKISDGVFPYNMVWKGLRWVDGPLEPLVTVLKERNIVTYGWQYVYGNEPRREAKVAADRLIKFDLDGFLVDAESQYKSYSKRSAAKLYMSELRKRLGPDFPIGLSSYRFPRLHRGLPWKEFLQSCNFNAPQVYWMWSDNPAEQLERSLEEFRSLEKTYGLDPLPFIPVGAAYTERGWTPKPEELDEFHKTVRKLKLPGECWWELSFVKPLGFAEVIAAHTWSKSPPIAPMPQKPPTIEERLNDLEERVSRLEKLTHKH